VGTDDLRCTQLPVGARQQLQLRWHGRCSAGAGTTATSSSSRPHHCSVCCGDRRQQHRPAGLPMGGCLQQSSTQPKATSHICPWAQGSSHARGSDLSLMRQRMPASAIVRAAVMPIKRSSLLQAYMLWQVVLLCVPDAAQAAEAAVDAAAPSPANWGTLVACAARWVGATASGWAGPDEQALPASLPPTLQHTRAIVLSVAGCAFDGVTCRLCCRQHARWSNAGAGQDWTKQSPGVGGGHVPVQLPAALQGCGVLTCQASETRVLDRTQMRACQLCPAVGCLGRCGTPRCWPCSAWERLP